MAKSNNNKNDQTSALAPAQLNKYENAIADADELLASKKYQEAQDAYVTASQMSPDDENPRLRIKEIDELLNATSLASKDIVREAEENDGSDTIIIGEKESEALVEIRALEDHTCNIFGVVYTIRNGRTHKVPKTVAAILSNSGKAIRR